MSSGPDEPDAADASIVEVAATDEALADHLKEHGYAYVDEGSISLSLLCPIDQCVIRMSMRRANW